MTPLSSLMSNEFRSDKAGSPRSGLPTPGTSFGTVKVALQTELPSVWKTRGTSLDWPNLAPVVDQ